MNARVSGGELRALTSAQESHVLNFLFGYLDQARIGGERITGRLYDKALRAAVESAKRT